MQKHIIHTKTLQNMQGKDQHVHPSFPVDINENKFSFFFFFGLLLFKGTCFKFYLILF